MYRNNSAIMQKNEQPHTFDFKPESKTLAYCRNEVLGAISILSAALRTVSV
jgi:hypothetical protein